MVRLGSVGASPSLESPLEGIEQLCGWEHRGARLLICHLLGKRDIGGMSECGELGRYAALMETLIAKGPAFAPESETETAVQVERGVVYPRALRMQGLGSDAALDRLVNVARSGQADSMMVLDRLGHRRPFYRGLLVYSWARAIQIARGAEGLGDSQEAMREWCARLEREVAGVEWGRAFPASQGQEIAAGCWSALALHVVGQVLGEASRAALAGRVFEGLVSSQQGNGAFLRAGASDNPETWWYHELVILHAVASYAADRGEEAMLSAVSRNAEYHQNETQPDHATTQPLGVFAFAVSPTTRPLADQILHAVQIQHPGGVGGVAAMLLADGVWCMRSVGG